MAFDPSKLRKVGFVSRESLLATLTAPDQAPRVPDHDAADQKLGRDIAEALGLEGWTEENSERLAEDLARLAGMQRFMLGHTLSAAGEAKRRRQLKAEREIANRRARVFEAAARAILESTERTERLLYPEPVAVRGYPSLLRPPPPPDNPKDPLLLFADLSMLTQRERAIVGTFTEALKARGHFADDLLAEWMANTLAYHHVEPTAYIDEFKGEALGKLVTACAMMRGETPAKASWVVKAAERLRARYREIVPESEPNPWKLGH